MINSTKKLKLGSVYRVTGGSFKGSLGLLQAGFSKAGILWLKTGIDCRILVSIDQIELES